MSQQFGFDKTSNVTGRQSILDVKAQQSIRRHQVRSFINSGTGSTQISFVPNDQNSQLFSHFLQLKASCSEVKMEIKHKQMEQYKYKDQISFTVQKVKCLQNERNKIENQISKLKNIVEEVKTKKMNTLLGYKSYEHVLDRMKKDEIKNQMRRNDLQRELKTLQKRFKELHNKNYDLREYQYLSYSGVKQASSEINELSSHRKDTISNMNSIIEQKNILEKKKQERKDQTDIIKQMAAGDLQDADLIRMKKFLTAQKFLKLLLKQKIEKIKQFYEPYELAFLKIKTNTNAKDATTLKSQFHNFENHYAEKAMLVKELENQIQYHESSKKQLEKDFQLEKNKQLEILEQMQQSQQFEITVNKKELQEKAQFSTTKMMTIKEWLKEQSKRMKISEKSCQVEMFKQICSKLMLSKLQQSKQ